MSAISIVQHSIHRQVCVQLVQQDTTSIGISNKISNNSFHLHNPPTIIIYLYFARLVLQIQLDAYHVTNRKILYHLLEAIVYNVVRTITSHNQDQLQPVPNVDRIALLVHQLDV